MRRVSAVFLVFLAACSRDLAEPPNEISNSVQHTIAANGAPGSQPGFHFLPPIDYTKQNDVAEWDVTLDPKVTICEMTADVCAELIASFSGEQIQRFDGERAYYIANWKADDPRLKDDRNYRITVTIGELTLGFADMRVVDSKDDYATVPPNFVVVKRATTLPITFRVQRGAVKVITDAGGDVSALEGGAQLSIPAGALTTTTALSIVPIEDPTGEGTPVLVPGTSFDFRPDGTSFGAPARLTLSYDPALVPGGESERIELGIFHFDDGVWSLVPGSTVDADAHTVSAMIDGFSSYSIGVIAAGITGAFSVGDSHSCAIRNGTTYCWGSNQSGQLGIGTNTRFESRPVPITGGAFVLISAGLAHTCALDAAGAAWCWGSNNFGQLGVSGNTNSFVPVRVATNLVFQDISAGGFHTCGLTADGNVWCWGDNRSGELGNGAPPNGSTSPVHAFVEGVEFATISAGGLNTCALSTTFEAYCWGGNPAGQLGDGSSTDRSVPTPVVGDRQFKSLVIASVNSFINSTCAVDFDGAAWCWGSNQVDQLGSTTAETCTFNTLVFACARSPQRVTGSFVYDLVIPGRQHSCGLTTAGQVTCWGFNRQGQLGDGTQDSRATPALAALVGGPGGAVELIGVGSLHSCAQTRFQIFCWGFSTAGQVGTGLDAFEPLPVLVQGSGWTSVTAGSCATDGSGSVFCWGAIPPGATDPAVISETHIPTAMGFGAFTGLSGRLCALNQSGAAYCWGEAGIPVAVPGGHTFTSISAGTGHVCGVTPAGQIWCWGNNSTGQLGNGLITSSAVPVLVNSTETFTKVAAGGGFTCGLTTDAEVYCWGLGRFGQLGFRWTDDLFPGTRLTPQLVAGVTGASRLAAGSNQACVILSGALWCWGSGLLGNGVSTTSGGTGPILITAITNVVDVNIGGQNSCAITSGGSLHCWGLNSSGAVGDGTLADKATPQLVAGLSGVASVATNGSVTCALTNAQVIYCFGGNAFGQAGAPIPYVLRPALVTF